MMPLSCQATKAPLSSASELNIHLYKLLHTIMVICTTLPLGITLRRGSSWVCRNLLGFCINFANCSDLRDTVQLSSLVVCSLCQSGMRWTCNQQVLGVAVCGDRDTQFNFRPLWHAACGCTVQLSSLVMTACADKENHFHLQYIFLPLDNFAELDITQNTSKTLCESDLGLLHLQTHLNLQEQSAAIIEQEAPRNNLLIVRHAPRMPSSPGSNANTKVGKWCSLDPPWSPDAGPSCVMPLSTLTHVFWVGGAALLLKRSAPLQKRSRAALIQKWSCSHPEV